jgi:hypothetical protein
MFTTLAQETAHHDRQTALWCKYLDRQDAHLEVFTCPAEDADALRSALRYFNDGELRWGGGQNGSTVTMVVRKRAAA